MKSGSFSAVLAGVLVVTAFAAAWQVSRLYFATRQLRGLQPSVMDANNRLNLAQALLNDTLEYSKRNPSIDPLLVSLNLKTNSTGGATPKPVGK